MKKNDALEKRLADAGVVSFDDARDWLGFSDEEKTLMDMQIAAERAVEREMKAKRVSQAELARRMGTKQPAVSRMIRRIAAWWFARCILSGEMFSRAFLALRFRQKKTAL